ncbi:MAG: ABC transporter ATP-binding protein [Methyloligellaceae bacterium]
MNSSEQKSLIEIDKVSKYFSTNSSLFSQKNFQVRAVDNISCSIIKGETLCVVGESGCGKTTLGRMIIGLLKPSSGTISYDGRRLDQHGRKDLRQLRSRMQMIFQNPYASLNPRMTIQQTLEEPVYFHKPEMKKQDVKNFVAEVMLSVGNDPSWGERYPHEFSGGQRQRISIARALMVEPEFIVADEPVSALDVSVQAQVLNVLMKARDEKQLTYLFISHDLSVVRHIGDRIIVMYMGTICEIAAADDLFSTPLHPYTQLLLSAIPRLNGTKEANIQYGEKTASGSLPGCVFHNRCPLANSRCRTEVPQLREIPSGRKIACHAEEENRF